jgi:DNA-binding MarR family transcriptional regulator
MKRSEENAQRLMEDFYRVARSRHALFYDLLSGYGITMHQFHLLMYLKKSGRMKVTDLGNLMLVSMPTASRMLNTMCDKGLVKKTGDAKDRRLSYVELTSEGERVVEQAHARQRDVLAEVMEEMPASEMESFLGIMEKIADKLTSLMKKERGDKC